MKKLLAIFALLVVVTTGFSEVTRTGLIRPGGNIMNKMTFTTADSCVTSDTLTITISNIQKYLQHVTATYTLDSLSGDPSISVTLYGRVTSNGSWTSIGTATWNDEADNPQSISSTTPANYNWYKLQFIASGATQESRMLTLDVRTSNAFDIPVNSGTLTISRATSGTVTVQTADDNANAAAVYRAGGTGALTLGAATGTTAITSSDWAIGATGAMTGIGAITADGLITGTAGATISGATTSVNASSNFATNINTGTSTGALSLGGGSGTVAVNSSTWDITTAGVASGLTKATVTKDADNVILDPGTDLQIIDVQVNSASVFNVDTTGMVNATYMRIPTVVANTDGTETLTAAQSGAFVTASKSDGATTITIPDPGAATIGVYYRILQMADQDLVVTCATANSNGIVCDGVATTDNVTISTSSHKIGAGMYILGISATKWYVGGLNPESVLTPEAAD